MDHIKKEDDIYPVSEDDGAASVKILVKLKLGKTAPPPEDQEKKHYCKECDKSFVSGKALGGHMSSAHVQANKDYSDRKLSSKTKRHITFSGTAADFTCNLCGKSFPSEKSLFGHMRCHPERCYRGMEPPATSSPPTSSDDDSGGGDQIVSGPVDLKSWPPGIKRGRGPYGIHVRAAHEIVRMVGNGPPKRAKSGCDSDVESPMWDEDDERVRTAVEVLKHMKKGEKHTCDLCNKGFTSHQALGGHMSSHTKLKVPHGQPKTMSDDGGSSGNGKIIKPSDGKVVIGFDLNVMPDEEEE